MVSSYAPGTELATIFCVIAWLYLSIKNFKNKLLAFGLGCLASSIAYSVASIQYYYIFFVDKVPESGTAMNLLFIRMIFHCTSVLIFIYKYKLVFQSNLNK